MLIRLHSSLDMNRFYIINFLQHKEYRKREHSETVQSVYCTDSFRKMRRKNNDNCCCYELWHYVPVYFAMHEVIHETWTMNVFVVFGIICLKLIFGVIWIRCLFAINDEHWTERRFQSITSRSVDWNLKRNLKCPFFGSHLLPHKKLEKWSSCSSKRQKLNHCELFRIVIFMKQLTLQTSFVRRYAYLCSVFSILGNYKMHSLD